MKRLALLILIFTSCSSSLLAQLHGNVLGFNKGDSVLARFLIKETLYPGPEVNTDEVHSSVLVMLKFNITEDGAIDSIEVLNPRQIDEPFVKAARDGLLETTGMWLPRDTEETIIIPFVFLLEERPHRIFKKDSKYNMNIHDYFELVSANGESALVAKILIPVYVHGFFEKPAVH